MIRRKGHPKHFFSREEQETIVKEIIEAEKKTSGEIRVHLNRFCGKDVMEKAKEVFFRLGMHRTENRNGILIYIATAERRFAILGDQGIHGHLTNAYWNHLRDEMQVFFREGRFLEGLCFAIRKIGAELQKHFPAAPQDVNELPNQVSEEA